MIIQVMMMISILINYHPHWIPHRHAFLHQSEDIWKTLRGTLRCKILSFANIFSSFFSSSMTSLRCNDDDHHIYRSIIIIRIIMCSSNNLRTSVKEKPWESLSATRSFQSWYRALSLMNTFWGYILRRHFECIQIHFLNRFLLQDLSNLEMVLWASQIHFEYILRTLRC